ncbi:MAG: hypothetical protein M3246_01105 [Actinomycetota bacterium]|nr:hypothetical protein [Actinomycetota bacterium]
MNDGYLSQRGRAGKMRVLLSFEEEYRTYMEAMAAAIREFRSDAEVVDAEIGELEAEVERFDPQLTITSPRVPENPLDDRLSRIYLSPEPKQPSRFQVGERRWESTNPTLGEILSVIDETKRLLRTSREQEPPDIG